MQNRPDNRIYACFFVRLAAYIVDTVIVWAAMLIVRIPVWVTTISSPDNFLDKRFYLSIFYQRYIVLHYAGSIFYPANIFHGFNTWKEALSDKGGDVPRIEK